MNASIELKKILGKELYEMTLELLSKVKKSDEENKKNIAEILRSGATEADSKKVTCLVNKIADSIESI